MTQARNLGCLTGGAQNARASVKYSVKRAGGRVEQPIRNRARRGDRPRAGTAGPGPCPGPLPAPGQARDRQRRRQRRRPSARRPIPRVQTSPASSASLSRPKVSRRARRITWCGTSSHPTRPGRCPSVANSSRCTPRPTPAAASSSIGSDRLWPRSPTVVPVPSCDRVGVRYINRIDLTEVPVEELLTLVRQEMHGGLAVPLDGGVELRQAMNEALYDMNSGAGLPATMLAGIPSGVAGADAAAGRRAPGPMGQAARRRPDRHHPCRRCRAQVGCWIWMRSPIGQVPSPPTRSPRTRMRWPSAPTGTSAGSSPATSSPVSARRP